MPCAHADSGSEYGDELVYDSELDEALRTAESCTAPAVPDIEDAVAAQGLAPLEEFRRRGFLSVSDLVATVWCEVQFDYRLRTLPYLPIERRPYEITTTKGATISVDKAKVEGKERILKRGETIHKRLEREIHPAEVTVLAESREDSWGLRMLNMFSAMEALMSIGKCRELPVAGFVDDVLVMGIIDEVTREPIVDTPTKGRQTRTKKREESSRQASLNDYFGGTQLPAPPTHRLRVSDSKTRASGSMPREEDTLAGRLQLMLYKELLDGLLVQRLPSKEVNDAVVVVSEREPGINGHAEVSISQNPASFLPTSNPTGAGLWRVWEYLALDTTRSFSDTFIAQSRPVVEGNDLRFGVAEGRTLADFAASWAQYVAALGIGSGDGHGRTDDALELVYRRAAPKRRKDASRKRPKSDRRRKKKAPQGTQDDGVVPVENSAACRNPAEAELDEDAQIQLATQLSIQDTPTSDATVYSGSAVNPIAVDSPEPQVPTEVPSAPPSLERRPTDTGSEALDSEAGQAKTASTISPSCAACIPRPIDAVVLPTPPKSSVDAGAKDKYSVEQDTGGHAAPETDIRQSRDVDSDSERERENADLAWSVEMSLGTGQEAPDDVTSPKAEIGVMSPSSQPKPATRRSRSPSPGRGSASGTIIGRHRFMHDPVALAAHLESVLGYWRGAREPRGVGPDNVRRCGWCEFEEGCEWRITKAQEAWDRYRARSQHTHS